MADEAGTTQQTAASKWRIELARELMPFYTSQDGIKMIVLGGSPSKGISDDYSDLDIIVFWDKIDGGWLERVPLGDIECERAYFRKMGEADIYLESYYFGELKVDLGHLTMDVWKEMVDDVLVRHETSASSQGSLGGFLSSLPLYGEDLVESWKERVAAYPEELALKMVKGNLRFYVKGYLANQAFGRGEILAYYDGLCQMLKKLLDILAGLNRMYAFTEEPRWVEYYLGRMPICPAKAWDRMRRVLADGGEGGVEILDDLIDDVLNLVVEHMPDVDVERIRRLREAMTVRARREKPEVRRRGSGGAPA